MKNKNEIVLYQPDEAVKLEVRLENETVWLNRQQMAVLFGRDVKTISKHINNALKEELAGLVVVANFATTTQHGAMAGKTQTHDVEYFGLDVITSVGYRVKSQQGIYFRRWANAVLKEYLINGYVVNRKRFQWKERTEDRIALIENRLEDHQEKIDFFVRTALPPVEGIFYEGQMFEPFEFINKLIRSARHRIVLIDNYVDDTVLLRLAERGDAVTATIYTQQTSPSFAVALQKHNAQYSPITVHHFTKSHDRFLIIDDDVYHIGASIKDLGKKWFAFCKMQMTAKEILGRLS
ncbi:MAG: virulence RhuM family protein [Paludibacteraceae bacterium]|nr:virulence RhuM family protein [Paludibacteraceae bacterium]